MPIFQPRITKNFYDRQLLYQKLFDIILQIIYYFQPREILQLCNQSRNSIIYKIDPRLTHLNVEVTQLQILPLLQAPIKLRYQLPKLVIGLHYSLKLDFMGEDCAHPFEVLLLGV